MSYSRPIPHRLLLQHVRDPPPSAKEQQANAGRSQTHDLGDLSMRIGFRMGEPEQLPIPRPHTCHRAAQHRLRVEAGRSILCGKELLWKLLDRGGLRTAPMVTQQVGRYPEQVAPANDLALV